MGYEFKGRNANYTNPYIESSDRYSQYLYLDFSFNFTTPNPRYERIIVERDKLGRIVHSKPPLIGF